MNAARIHDKQKLREFWEQRIVQHSEQTNEEQQRMRSSALARLREQWVVRLEQRNRHLQSFFEERMRRGQNLGKPVSPRNQQICQELVKK